MILKNFLLFLRAEASWFDHFSNDYESEISEFSYSSESSEVSEAREYEENEAEESYFGVFGFQSTPAPTFPFISTTSTAWPSTTAELSRLCEFKHFAETALVAFHARSYDVYDREKAKEIFTKVMSRLSDIAHGQDPDCDLNMFNCDHLVLDREEHACILVRRVENLVEEVTTTCPRVEFSDFELLQSVVQPKHITCPYPKMLKNDVKTMNKQFKKEYEKTPTETLVLALEEYEIKLAKLVEKSNRTEMEEYPEMQSDAFGPIIKEEEEIEDGIFFLEEIIARRTMKQDFARNYAKLQFQKKGKWTAVEKFAPFSGFSANSSPMLSVRRMSKPEKFHGAWNKFPDKARTSGVQVKPLNLAFKEKETKPQKPVIHAPKPWNEEGTTTEMPSTTTMIIDISTNPGPSSSTTSSTTTRKTTITSTTTTTKSSGPGLPISTTSSTTTRSTTTTTTTQSTTTTTTTTAITFKGDEPNPNCPPVENPTWWICRKNGNTCMLPTCGGRQRLAFCRVRKGVYFWKGNASSDNCDVPEYALATTTSSTITTTRKATTAITSSTLSTIATASATTTTSSIFKGDEPTPKCPPIENPTWWICRKDGFTCMLPTCGGKKRVAICRVKKGVFFWKGNPSTENCGVPEYATKTTTTTTTTSTTTTTTTTSTTLTATNNVNYIGDEPNPKCPPLPSPTWWNCKDNGTLCSMSTCGRRPKKAFCRNRKVSEMNFVPKSLSSLRVNSSGPEVRIQKVVKSLITHQHYFLLQNRQQQLHDRRQRGQHQHPH